MRRRIYAVVFALMTIGLSPVWAQEPAQQAGEMDVMPGMDHGKMDHGPMPGAAQDAGQDMNDMNHAGGMGHGSMQGGSPPPDARDPHAYSGGYDFGPIPPPHMGDTHPIHGLLVDRLERAHARDNSTTEYDLQAWYGRTYDRAVLKAEGEIDGGKSREARTELLWGHAVATYWDAQLGARYDSGTGPDRKWLAFGVQGLAPYWFELEATAYIGEQGRTALRFAAEYELLLTQRLILQPRVEANAYGKRDAERALGSGLSNLVAGVRLRYEIRRELAPYVGIERTGKFGVTADYARDAGEDTHDTRLVAGLRFWF